MITDASYLPNLLSRVAQLACTCLEESTPLGRPANCGLYHGSPPADCCDLLAVWLERLVPSKPDALKCQQTLPVAHVGVTLFRPCWPVIKPEPNNPFRGLSAEADLAAAKLDMDAITLFCCLMSDLSDDQGFIKGGEILVARMGALTPGRPQGGCASWTVRFQLELSPCCPMVEPVT